MLEGQLNIELRDRTVALGRGKPLIVPRSVEHWPVAEHACQVMPIERSGTPNTGDAKTVVPRRLI